MAKDDAATVTSAAGRNRWVQFGAGILLIAVVVLAVVAFTRGGGSTKRPAALDATPVTIETQQASVDVVDNKFEPPVIRVKKGATVTWYFKGKVPHSVRAAPGAGVTFDSGIMTSGEFSYTFDTAGSFDYRCSVHPDMWGTVEVTG